MTLTTKRVSSAFLAVLVWAGVCKVAAGAQQNLASSSAAQTQVAAKVPDPSGVLPGALSRLQGLPVAEIHIAAMPLEHPDWLEPLLAQKVNEPLDKYKVRQSVQALYNTGQFSEIQVEAQRNDGEGVILSFVTKPNFFFGSIRVEGAPEIPSENQLVNAGKLTLGDSFSEDKINSAIQGMQRLLQENGYYRATIQPFYDWNSKDQQVKMVFAVTKGPRAHVGQVIITGIPGYNTEEILETAKIHPGDIVSASRVTRALSRLRKKYQKKNRLEAQVTLTRRDYRPQTNTLDYTFDIIQGPAVEVKVEGAGMREVLIKKYVPIYEENAVDDDLLNEGARNIRDYFQTKGYFDSKVSFTQKVESPDRRQVIFDVDQGERHKVLGIEIQGNHYFPRETIRERMEMQSAGGLLLHGLYSHSILARDIQSIENLYRTNGFLQVKVSSNVQDDYDGKTGHIKVTIRIEEGPQTVVGKLVVQGNSYVPQEKILELVSLTPGQPYSDSTVAADQSAVTNYYFNRGFPDVRFESFVKPEADNPERMDLAYKITEGPQIFVDKVLFSGLHYTKGFVVEREMAIHSGEPLSQEQMLESQRRLYDMGIFNAVEMAVQNPEGEATHKNVALQLTEARRYTFNYGIGFEVQTGQPTGSSNPQGNTGASARVSFNVTRLNFRGRDHTITLQTRYGNLQKRALISYGAPRWFDQQNLTLSFTAFYDDTFDVRTFEAKRLEGSAEIKQRLNKGTTLLYRFIYRRVSVPSDKLLISQNLIPLFSQPVRVGMPAFTYIRDTRDDPTESHKGAFTTLDSGLAGGFFGSEANFSRLLVQNSTYYRFYKKRWVFARSTRVGVEGPFGSTTFIPLPERFLTGGANSHRGFGVNQAGPRDLQTGFPLGGEAIFLNNLELRTPPLPLPFVGNDVSAVVFHDMGNVFAAAGDVADSLLRWVQPNRDTCTNTVTPSCNFNYMSHAVGGGIRYRTPIGPISFDMGYNLNPPVFPIAVEKRSDTLKHFNFFFSIGQTF